MDIRRPALIAALGAVCVASLGAAAAMATSPQLTSNDPNADPAIASLHLFDTDKFPNARCLDGSPSGIYYRAATDAASMSKWFIVLEGGGICTTHHDCLKRAPTPLGSSKSWPASANLTAAWGFLNANATQNPLASFNIAVLKYCGGDLHTGTRTMASNDTFGLYFAGHLSVVAMVEMLSASEYGLNNSDLVVFAGGSAGGVGVFNNYERVAELLPGVRVVGAPIGGFPPQVTWYTGPNATTPGDDLRTPAFRDHVALYQSAVNSNCAAALGPQLSWSCILPYVAYPHLQTPIFVIESLSDAVVLCDFEGLPCSLSSLTDPHVGAYINEYAHNASSTLQAVVSNKARDGVFAASCLLHTGFVVGQPTIDGVDALHALYNWAVAEPGKAPPSTFIDKCASYWPPCNKNCPWPPSASSRVAAAEVPLVF